MTVALVFTFGCLPGALVLGMFVVRRGLWTVAKAVWIVLPFVVVLDVVVVANLVRLLNGNPPVGD
jgi:hypothetical protein